LICKIKNSNIKKLFISKIKKTLLICCLQLVIFNAAYSQINQYRVLNPNNPSLTFLYTVELDKNALTNATTATVTRQTIASVPTDSTGTYIIGSSWSYIDLSNQLILPVIENNNWYRVDENFGGASSIISGGELGITITCDCEAEGTCDVNRTGNCVTCKKINCIRCKEPKGGSSNFTPLLINASSIIYSEEAATPIVLVHRVLSHLDTTQAFVYNITININNSVSVVRTTDIALPEDRYTTKVLGDGASFNIYTNQLSLPTKVGFNWHSVDSDGLGGVDIIDGGEKTYNCPCSKKNKSDCEIGFMGNCMECVAAGDCVKCGTIVEVEPVSDPKFAVLIIQASSINFVSQ
jgi:hypothetical protein